MRSIILLSALALMATAQAQTAQQVTIGDNMNYGITYSLPQTAVSLTVQAHCTQVKAGPFAPYAEKYLGLKDVPQVDETLYGVDQITLTPVARADSSRTYHIQFSEKGALPTFYLTEAGTLWAINQAPEQPSQPVAAAPAASAKLTLKPSDVMTSEMLKAGSKAKQAELCAEEIFSIRESRSELIRGEADNVPNDGKQLQLMLDNLTAQEEALLSLFVGTTTTTPLTRTFDYVPVAEVERALAFRFSADLGFVDADDLAGAPYYIAITLLEDNRMSPMDLKALKKLEKGIAFCVPGKAHVRLFTASQTLVEGDLQMAQFGHVEQLPQGQFTDKKRPSAASFAPTTGSLHLFEQTPQQ